MKATLAEIVENKQVEVTARKRARSQESIKASLSPARGAFLAAISQSPVNIIAEIKPRSPSAGLLRDATQSELEAIARIYARHAGAISILTDERYFGGSLSLLAAVSSVTSVPLLCKDFIIDAYQVYEAREAGAEAVLLIVKILDDAALSELQRTVRALNMKAVIEVQTEDELQRALKTGPEVVLINNRDLSTFDIDLDTTKRLAALIPPELPFISASGIEATGDIERLLPFTNKFLIGSSIMRSPNVESKLKELCEVRTSCTG